MFDRFKYEDLLVLCNVMVKWNGLFSSKALFNSDVGRKF